MEMEQSRELARSVFDSLVRYFNQIELNFKQEENEDAYCVRFIVEGDDIPMKFVMEVDIEHQLLRVLSPQSVTFKPEQLPMAAQAVCAINYYLIDGHFDLDLSDGTVIFCLCTSFAESLVSDQVFDYLLSLSVTVVEEYNDKLFLLSKGILSLEELRRLAEP